MIIAGIGGFKHDYNVCILDTERGTISMGEEERFTGKKHHAICACNPTAYAVKHCLHELGRGVDEVHLAVFAGVTDFPAKGWLSSLFPKAKTISLEHHLCHIAAAFYASGFHRSLVLSLDGFGDGSSGCLALGDGNRIEVLAYLPDRDSLGLEYLRVTSHIGLGGYGSEGKTMGLAPYGNPVFLDCYEEQVELLPDGLYRLGSRLRFHTGFGFNLDYQDVVHTNSDFLHAICPRRSPFEPLDQVHKDLAASLQGFLERVVTHILSSFQKQTGLVNLCLTGGVAMNSTLNGLIERTGRFENCFFLPNASDRGLGMGAALCAAHHQLGIPRFFTMKHVYFGSEYSQSEIEKTILECGYTFEKSANIEALAADLLAQGKVLGWFQGRSEVGARALGNRSILADPRSSDMRTHINCHIKHRELFRPFAPSVLVDKAVDYFRGAVHLPFMMTTSSAKAQNASKIPAVVHVDGSSRIQTVDDRINPRFWRLIKEFEARTGTPLLLNTSFNDKGHPIVETPEDAIEAMELCNLDALVIGDCVVWADKKR